MKAINNIKIHKSQYKILTHLYATLPEKEVKRYILTVQKLFPYFKRDKIESFHYEELYWYLVGLGFKSEWSSDSKYFEVDFVNRIVKR